MKVLIASLLKRKVTPDTKSSRPRIIFELVSGLVKKGIEVTVLATGDTYIPGAKVIPVIPKQFVDMGSFENPFYAENSFLVQLAKKIEDIGNNFDIIHNHTYPEFINLLIAKNLKTPLVTTIHAQATPELDRVLSLFNHTYFISISEAHKKLFKETEIYKVVYNGIDTSFYDFKDKKEDYLLWLGRLAKAKDKNGNFLDPKGVRWAIKLAEQTDSKLIISGNVEDINFYKKDVKPHLSDKIRWVGPISSELPLERNQVVKLMQGAKAFLMTINWYEPFGLVMAESMSCGTPIIAFDRGSVSELVVDSKTGFVVDSKSGISGLKEALSKIKNIKPKDCRKHVEDNFSIGKMVENYIKAYREINAKK